MTSDIEKRLFEIEERDTRVEIDKAWETSLTRRFTIVALTYVIVATFLSRVHPENMWIDALIPCAGYMLSTLSLPAFKRAWMRRETDNDEASNDDDLLQ